jgi:hypothetical protein
MTDSLSRTQAVQPTFFANGVLLGGIGLLHLFEGLRSTKEVDLGLCLFCGAPCSLDLTQGEASFCKRLSCCFCSPNKSFGKRWNHGFVYAQRFNNTGRSLNAAARLRNLSQNTAERIASVRPE